MSQNHNGDAVSLRFYLETRIQAIEKRITDLWDVHAQEHIVHQSYHDQDHVRINTALDKAFERLEGPPKGIGLAWGVAIALAGLGIAILGFLATR